MDEHDFDCRYDAGTSTLELYGRPDADWPRLVEELERAFRRTACHLTVDLRSTSGLPAHQVGRIVQVCNACFPGTLVRPPDPVSPAA